MIFQKLIFAYTIILACNEGSKKSGFVLHPKERVDLTDDELVIVMDFSKSSKYACLYIRNEHTHEFKVLNYADGQNRNQRTQAQVTKSTIRKEHGKKSEKAYMKRLKVNILKDNQPCTSSTTDNSTPFAYNNNYSLRSYKITTY